MTYQQATERKWQVKKGSKSTTIFFTKKFQKDDDEAEDGKRSIRFLKSYAVFHASQVEGLPPYEPPSVEECPWTRPEAASIILKNSGAEIRTGGDRAFYSPTFDFIQLLPDHAFRGPPEFAAVALHELAHYTGHSSRLNRDLTGAKGSKKYSFEELIAETTSAFLGLTLNIPTEISNHASYIGHWLEILKEDKRALFRAAAQAQLAADWILNLHPDFAAKAEPERPATPQTQALHSPAA